MRNATVKWFNVQKGYGFLVDSETKEDIFCHYSQLQMDGFKSLDEDDLVEYELGAGNDGRQQAVNVIPVLTRRMIQNSLKEENLYIRSAIKDGYGVTKYQVVDGNNALQSGENGMTFMELAEYAGYEIVEKSA